MVTDQQLSYLILLDSNVKEARLWQGRQRGGSAPGGSSYMKLHSSFPPFFCAKPGESWKDYWRSVEFCLVSEDVRAQLKERAAK